jgi:hypothetical protein
VSQKERSVFCEVIVSVILSKKSVYVHVSYSERFPNFHCTAHCTLYRRATRHVLTRVAKCIDVDGGIFENVLYWVNCTNFVTWTINAGIRNITLDIATGYGLDDWGGQSSSLSRVKNIVFSTSSRPALGPTQSPVQCVPGVKRHEAGGSATTSAEVKKTWIYTSTPPYAFMS